MGAIRRSVDTRSVDGRSDTVETNRTDTDFVIVSWSA
jgi:hypothetical protein